MKPQLIAGDENLKEFILDLYQIEDPVICIWSGPEAKNPKEYDHSYMHLPVDYFKFFAKEQFNSLFFPNGIIKKDWNLVLATLKQDSDICRGAVIQGWLMSVDLEKFSFEFDF